MNLMFWKKKPEAGNDTEDAHKNASINNPESPNAESNEQEAHVKMGLVAQIKSKFTSFTQRFRKSPAFQAGEDYASNAHDSSKTAPDNTPTRNSASKQSDLEIPEKLGLVAQIKSKLAALVLRFKKKPEPDAETEADQKKDTRSRSKGGSEEAEETHETPSVVMRIKLGLIAFITHHKMLLVFTLLLLLLIGIVYAAWNIIFPPLERKRGVDKTPAHESAPPEQSQIKVEALQKKDEEPAHTETPKKDSPEQTQAGVEALKKKSEEEPAHTEAPKKDSHEQTPAGASVLMKKNEEIKAGVEAPKKSGSEQAQTEAEELKNKSEDAQALAEALKKESEDAQAQAETLKKQSAEAQARAEVLRKKEVEEKARAEALKKKESEEKARAEALKKKESEEKARAEALKKSSQTPPNKGEITVNSKEDPKTTAKSLKEAIEAMNADAEEPTKPPLNKRPLAKPTHP